MDELVVLAGQLWHLLLHILTHLLGCNSTGFHILGDILHYRRSWLTHLMSNLDAAMVSQASVAELGLGFPLTEWMPEAMVTRGAALHLLTDRVFMSNLLLPNHNRFRGAGLVRLQVAFLDQDGIHLLFTG